METKTAHEIDVDIELAKMREVIQATRDEWFKVNTPTLAAEVKKNLDQYQKMIICSALGFETDSWGRFRVDHCNGRNTVANDQLRKSAEALINTWFSNILTLPDLTDKELLDLQKEYKDTVISKLKDKIRYRAEEAANSRLNEY